MSMVKRDVGRRKEGQHDGDEMTRGMLDAPEKDAKDVNGKKRYLLRGRKSKSKSKSKNKNKKEVV
jgi:hypothetical protein